MRTCARAHTLTHDSEQDLSAADAWYFLDFTLVGSGVWGDQAHDCDGGVTILWVGVFKVHSAL